MISQLDHPTKDQTAHTDFAESLKQAVIEQTDNGSRIVRSVIAIMEGDAPNCTPWHQLEAAKLLRKLGLGIAVNIKPPLPQAEEAVTQSLSTADHKPPLPQGEGENHTPSCSSMSANPEQTKFTNKLIRQVRIETYEGASIVRYLIEIMEGEDPGTKGRDRLEAIKTLLGICLNSPSFPSAEDMLLYTRCHPDCFCVCEGLPEDHPEVAKMHTPLTAEQRERMAKEQQAEQEERDRRIDEEIERKKRADKAWKLAQFHSPESKADRRIEREEQLKRRQQKREQEKQRRSELRDLATRETRFDIWQYDHRQEQERARSP